MLAAAALVAAVSGMLAIVTSSGGWATTAGIGAVVTAALASRSPAGQSPAVPLPTGEPGPADPERRLQDVPPIEEAAQHQSAAGVVDETVFALMLRGRLAMARRVLRPLSLVFVEVDDVDGLPETDVGIGLRCTLREADVAGQRDDGLYVLVLEDTGEDGAVWTAERLRRTLCADRPGRGFRAGVASYPTHGLDAADLESKAAEALVIARQWHVDRIEVAEIP